MSSLWRIGSTSPGAAHLSGVKANHLTGSTMDYLQKWLSIQLDMQPPPALWSLGNSIYPTFLTPPRCKWVPVLTGKVTCDGLASCPGGVQLLVT